MVGLDLDGDTGMGGLERNESRRQPLVGDRLDRNDPDPRGRAALALGDAVDVCEDALHLLQVLLTAPVEAHAAPLAVEQLDIEMLLQHPYAVGDGGGGDADFGRATGEALMPRRSLEETKAFERGKDKYGREPPHGRPGRMPRCDHTLAC